jgi:hypothetical protein
MWSSSTARASSSARRSWCVPAPFINYGMTQVSAERRLLGAPRARPAHAGVSVHLIDAGVDTAMCSFRPPPGPPPEFSRSDNIATGQRPDGNCATPPHSSDRGCPRRPPRPALSCLSPVVPPNALGLCADRRDARRVVTFSLARTSSLAKHKSWG